MLRNKESIIYTLKHKKEFLRVEKELLGRNTLSGYLHDSGKVILYIFFKKKTAHDIHVKFARHHKAKARTESDFIQMIIDWECARFTKPDKPLNAYDTLYKFYPEMESNILPLLKKFNLG
jgi:hypothetical protein